MNAFKNAFKVVANKFAFLWTHIAYYSLVIFLLVSLSLSVLVPYINKIVDDFNMMGRISEIGQAIIDNRGFAELLNLLKAFGTGLGSIFASNHSFPTIMILLGLSVVSRFVLGLADLAFYHVVDMHLSSAVRQSFRASFIRNIGRSAKFQLCKMLFALPADAAFFILLYFTSFIFRVPALLIFGPFLIIFVFIVAYSLRLALFSGWIPEILHSEGKNVFQAFFASLKLLKKNFARVYGAMVLYLVVVIALNIFFGIFTLGVGLFITLPLTLFILTVLNSTLYYQNGSLRYYIDKDTIIN